MWWIALAALCGWLELDCDLLDRPVGCAGFRTLVLGMRVVSAAEYAEWRPKWDEANVAMQNRHGRIEEAPPPFP